MDSGILYWFISRNRERNANNIAFNGSTTSAKSNDILAKTAYNGTVSGNVTIVSDGDGSYINLNGNRNHSLGTGTLAEVAIGTNPLLTQAGSFTIIVDFKPISSPTNNNSGVFGSNYDCCLWRSSTGTWRWSLRGSTTLDAIFTGITNNSRYQAIFVFDHTVNKFYMYLGDTLLNPGGTTGPTTFSCNDRGLGDRFVGSGNASSGNTWVYSSRVYSSALTDTERTAELALGQKQTARKDCVLEILPPYYAGTAALPTTIYDVKAFTPNTSKIILVSFALGADAIATADSQTLVAVPFFYAQLRDTPNGVQVRYDTGAGAQVSGGVNLGNGDRQNHILCYSYSIENGQQRIKVFLDGVKIDDDLRVYNIPTIQYATTIQIGKRGTAVLFNGSISNTKVFIGTITDAEGVAMSSGIPVNPANATLFTQPRRLPPYGTAMTDVSGNGYDFTLTP